MRGRRPKEAWRATGAGWRSELVYGLVAGALVCIYFTFTAWPEDPVPTVGLPIAAAVGAAILVPLVEFLWRLLWQPWTDMKARVADLATDDGHMGESERLIVVLRNYLRQGFELDAYRNRNRGAGAYYNSEKDDLEDWTHNVITCLTEYGTKAHCEKFIEVDKACPSGHAAHREWVLARIACLEVIIDELDPTPQAHADSGRPSTR